MDINNLLEQKSFETLTKEEQAFVLTKMSLDEYENERAIILASQQFFEVESRQIQPLAATPNKALLALRAKNDKQKKQEKKAWIPLLLSYKIPAWQAAAAILLVFFLVRGLGIASPPQTIILADEQLRDTVFIKEYITQVKELPTDTVIKVVYKDLDKNEKKSKKILALNKRSPSPKTNINVNPRAVVEEFDNVLQYSHRSSSIPASKDTFLQVLNNDLFY